MLSALEFRNKYVGQAIDVDGVAGVQCVDLFKQCCILAGKPSFAVGGSGYAYELARRFDALGLGTIFERVTLANVQYGDWIIWDNKSKDCPVSHVAMFEKWDGSSRIIVLGQNQGGANNRTDERSLSIQGIIGVFRLKAWKQQTSVPPKTTTSTPSRIQGSKIHHWVVDPGDTLSFIAAQMGQSVNAVASYNAIKNINSIKVGQTIKNPGYKG